MEVIAKEGISTFEVLDRKDHFDEGLFVNKIKCCQG